MPPNLHQRPRRSYSDLGVEGGGEDKEQGLGQDTEADVETVQNREFNLELRADLTGTAMLAGVLTVYSGMLALLQRTEGHGSYTVQSFIQECTAKSAIAAGVTLGPSILYIYGKYQLRPTGRWSFRDGSSAAVRADLVEQKLAGRLSTFPLLASTVLETTGMGPTNYFLTALAIYLTVRLSIKAGFGAEPSVEESAEENDSTSEVDQSLHSERNTDM